MLYPKAEWKINSAEEEEVKRLEGETGLSSVASRFLIQRGMTTKEEADAFIHMDETALHDPFLLKDMGKAVERIKLAVRTGSRILIFGDYDADGVTSTSLMLLTLRQLGADVGYYVPNRFTEGYGPNENAFRQAAEENVSLIITVDTGISAVYEAEVAKELGVDLIITDHHEPPPELPDGFAVINPKQEACSYPNENLAGAGVAFKVAHALLGRVPDDYYDLAAIGTIADLVSLTGENRFIAMRGVKALSRERRPGLQSLLEKAGAGPQEMSEEQVGFLIGPRLNAAGRLDSADPAIELLISDDMLEADELAQMIDELNKERQEIVKEIAAEAEKQAEEQGIPPVIIVGKEGWNPGVIGIVASRLVEKFYRPTIVLSYDNETGLAKGSARSIEGFDMFESLSTCRDWLPHFGGHPMAAGLTMDMQHIDQLREKLTGIALETLTEKDWQKSIHVDLPVTLNEVSLEAIEDLQQMAPFGTGNPAPEFMIEDVNLQNIKKIGASGDHLKLTAVSADADKELDCIGFGMGGFYPQISPLSKLSAVGKLGINEWNGRSKPQFIIKDLKIEEWQLFDFRGDKKLWTNEYLKKLNSCLVVMFQPETEKHTALMPGHWKVFRAYEDNGNLEAVSGAKDILFIDLPGAAGELEEILGSCAAIERLYAAFIHEKDHFFQTVPSREQFKWLYALFLKRRKFDLNESGAELAKYKGWTENTVHFMCQVFFELEFVKINNGVIEITSQPIKKDLTESFTYQRHIEQSRLENELYYSSMRELKQWLDKALSPGKLKSYPQQGSGRMAKQP